MDSYKHWRPIVLFVHNDWMMTTLLPMSMSGKYKIKCIIIWVIACYKMVEKSILYLMKCKFCDWFDISGSLVNNRWFCRGKHLYSWKIIHGTLCMENTFIVGKCMENYPWHLMQLHFFRWIMIFFSRKSFTVTKKYFLCIIPFFLINSPLNIENPLLSA